MTTHSAFLTLASGERIKIEVQKAIPWHYELVSAEGFDLTEQSLCFDLKEAGPEVVNRDTTSDSMSCFGLSEVIETPELTVNSRSFKAANLPALQAGLNRLRASFIPYDDY